MGMNDRRHYLPECFVATISYIKRWDTFSLVFTPFFFVKYVVLRCG